MILVSAVEVKMMKLLNSNISENYEKPEIFVVLFGTKNVIRTSTLVDTGYGNGEEDGNHTFQ